MKIWITYKYVKLCTFEKTKHTQNNNNKKDLIQFIKRYGQADRSLKGNSPSKRKILQYIALILHNLPVYYLLQKRDHRWVKVAPKLKMNKAEESIFEYLCWKDKRCFKNGFGNDTV